MRPSFQPFFRSHRLGLTTLLGLSALAILGSAPTHAASMVELAPDSRQGGSYQELKQVESILTTVAKMRALPVLRPIQVGLLDRTQLQNKLSQQIRDEIPPDKLRGEGALYQQLGMLPAGFDYAKFLLELYTEQIGGFYDPATRELKLIKGTPLTGLDQQMLISHELTHALQDQHYQLSKYMDSHSDNDDKGQAMIALIEGDATVSASEYVQAKASEKPFQGLLDVLGSAFNAARQIPGYQKFRAAPAFIRDSLIFPYDQGSQFVNAFRQQGWSWQDIATLYKHPPQATEHILHPNSYLSGEQPQILKLSLQSALGGKPLTASVWGELGYRQFLAQHLNWQDAKAAATGWRGDRYEVLQTPSGLVFGLFSVWDSDAEAQEFFKAWSQALAKRAPEAGSVSPVGGTLTMGDHRIWAEIRGNAVALVENLTPAQAKQIPALRASWQKALSEMAKPAPSQPIKRGM